LKIFITGVNGFIGQHLLLLLGEHDVLVLTRGNPAVIYPPNVNFVIGDLNQSDSYQSVLEKFKPECCIHLGWEGLPDYSFENNFKNLTATLTLFNLLARIKCSKVIGIGSCWEYGDQPGKLPESSEGENLGQFAVFKKAIYSIGQSFFKNIGIDFIWARIFYVYGPGQRTISLIPNSIDALSKNTMPSIRSPLAENDFIYVSDVAAALLALSNAKNVSGIFNIGSGHPIRVDKLVNVISQAMEKSEVFLTPEEESSASSSYADISKLHQLGWSPSVPLVQGVEKTLKAFGS
jgi:nucleoside-diphosphate-sugar epimerase